MSVRCKDCGAIAGYGHEIGHKSDCPALERAARIGRAYNKLMKLPDHPGEDIPIGPPPPPYPFCRTPEKCAGKGYCPADIACND